MTQTHPHQSRLAWVSLDLYSKRHAGVQYPSSPLPLMSQHTQRTEATEGYKIFGRLHREAHTENGFKAASEDSSMQGVVFYMVHTSSIHTLARKGQDCPLT